jgi:N-acetyl-alpha-D-glucosaminyl L-malate synthase BshA
VKNVGAVVEVFRRIAARRPARLLLVGDGPERVSVEAQVQRHGLSERVRFLGGQEYVEDILPLADVFLLPSLHESFGLVALEASACEVPVVASTVGGTPEVVTEGKTGFLRAPDDVDGMTEATERVLADPEFAASLGRAGRERATREFGLERIVPRYLALYESLLAGSRT